MDLGAAPGGWTWQLIQRGLHVIAVDNGSMSSAVMGNQVEHERRDAFQFKPPHRVNWMVCDIVDKPARVTDLVVKWIQHGWATYYVFNLKLPMRQRLREVQTCLDRLRLSLEDADIRYTMRAKHLYHDREEITVYLSVEAQV